MSKEPTVAIWVGTMPEQRSSARLAPHLLLLQPSSKLFAGLPMGCMEQVLHASCFSVCSYTSPKVAEECFCRVCATVT